MSILKRLKIGLLKLYSQVKSLALHGELYDSQHFGSRTVYCNGYRVGLFCVRHSYRALENIILGIKSSLNVFDLHAQPEQHTPEEVRDLFRMTCTFHMLLDPNVSKEFRIETLFEQYVDMLRVRARSTGSVITWTQD